MGKITKNAVILSAVPVASEMRRYLAPNAFVVACDAGYRNAERLGVQPDLIVGDFDSAPRPQTTDETIVLPHVKDDTDTHYAARYLLEQGYTRITMLGALGGARLEHSAADPAKGGLAVSFAVSFAGDFAGRDAYGRLLPAAKCSPYRRLSAGCQQRICAGHSCAFLHGGLRPGSADPCRRVTQPPCAAYYGTNPKARCAP